MSHLIVNRIRSAILPPSEKFVLWVLSDVANEQGVTGSYAPLPRLIAETCLSRQTVINAIKGLESKNIIMADRSNGRQTVYSINPNYAHEPVKPLDGSNGYTRITTDKTSLMAIPDQSNGYTAPVQPLDSIPLSLYPSYPPSCDLVKKTKIDRLRHFNDFYAAYPKKVGKESAKKAWAKIKVDDDMLIVILAALKSQSIGWTDPKFIPHPATWLNAKRWEDETSNQVAIESPAHSEPKIIDRGHLPVAVPKNLQRCRDDAARLFAELSSKKK